MILSDGVALYQISGGGVLRQRDALTVPGDEVTCSWLRPADHVIVGSELHTFVAPEAHLPSRVRANKISLYDVAIRPAAKTPDCACPIAGDYVTRAGHRPADCVPLGCGRADRAGVPVVPLAVLLDPADVRTIRQGASGPLLRSVLLGLTSASGVMP